MFEQGVKQSSPVSGNYSTSPSGIRYLSCTCPDCCVYVSDICHRSDRPFCQVAHSSPLLRAPLAACTSGYELTCVTQLQSSCTLQIEAVIPLLHYHHSRPVTAGIHLRMSTSQSKAGTLQQKHETHQYTPASVSLPTMCLPWQQIPYSETYSQQPVNRSTSAIRKRRRFHLQADAKHQNLSPNRHPPGVVINNTPLAHFIF